MKKKLVVAIALALGVNFGLGQMVQNDFTAKLGISSKAEAFNIFKILMPSPQDMVNSYSEMIAYYVAGFELSNQAAQVSTELLSDYGVQAELVNVNVINASSAGYDQSVNRVLQKGNSSKTVKMPDFDANSFFDTVPKEDARLAKAKRLVMLKDECFARGRNVGVTLAAQSVMAGNNKALAVLISSAIFLNNWKSDMDKNAGASYCKFEKSLKALNKVKVDKKQIKKAADGLCKG